jgi:hypothetical protein
MVLFDVRVGEIRQVERISGSDPTGIRTRVFAVRGRCPWPLDDGALPRSWKILPDARSFVKRIAGPAIRPAGAPSSRPRPPP